MLIIIYEKEKRAVIVDNGLSDTTSLLMEGNAPTYNIVATNATYIDECEIKDIYISQRFWEKIVNSDFYQHFEEILPLLTINFV